MGRKEGERRAPETSLSRREAARCEQARRDKETKRRRADMKTLKDVKVGETVTVAKLHGEGPVKRRIMDMGITKGVEIFVRKVAPLGDPMELNVRGYELSVRKDDAEMIEVQ
jgi:ferrous iron transport protein A